MTTTTEAPVKTAPPVDTATPVDPEADPATAPHRFASWAGKWTGVEGLYVTITPTEPEHYKLEMQSDLDTKGTYEGHDSEHGIQFERGGKRSEEHTSELQSLMRNSYAVFCLQKKNTQTKQ